MLAFTKFAQREKCPLLRRAHVINRPAVEAHVGPSAPARELCGAGQPESTLFCADDVAQGEKGSLVPGHAVADGVGEGGRAVDLTSAVRDAAGLDAWIGGPGLVPEAGISRGRGNYDMAGTVDNLCELYIHSSLAAQGIHQPARARIRTCDIGPLFKEEHTVGIENNKEAWQTWIHSFIHPPHALFIFLSLIRE